MKAEHFRIAKAANHAALVRTPKRVRGIEEQFEAVTSGDLFQRRNVTVSSPQVNGKYPAGLRGNQTLYVSRIDVVTPRIDIAKDRLDSQPLQRVRSGDEGKRRQDNFAFEPKRTNRDLQRRGCITRRNAVLHANQFDEALFKLDYVWSIVGKPPAIENVSNSMRKLLPVTDIRSTDVQWLLKRWATAKKGEIVNRFLRRAEAGLESGHYGFTT
jgi:hypothetical protein